MNKIRNARWAFFGTPEMAVQALETLADAGVAPALVITAPDKPAGRKMQLTPPPVKVWAQERGIDVLQPEKIDGDLLADLGNTEWDFFLVAAYGKLLPKALLEMPERGTLNIHPSLLPKLRGPSPVKSAILEDAHDAVGVSIMLLDEEMDHGPVLAQGSVELERLASGETLWPTADVLEQLLAREGARLALEALPEWLSSNLEPFEQNHDQATFTKKLVKDMCRVDPDSADQYETFRRIQACSPNPGAYFFVERGGKQTRVKVGEAVFDSGVLEIQRVVPEGRRAMDYQDFLRGQS